MSTKENIKLKPCPLCGDENPKIYMDTPNADMRPWEHVVCLSCGCAVDTIEKWQLRAVKNNGMTKIQLLEMLLHDAREMRKEGILSVLKRNSHLHNYFSEGRKDFDIDLADAVLTLFIDTVAMNQGVDYGLKSIDLYCEEWCRRQDKFNEIAKTDLVKAENFLEDLTEKAEKLRKEGNK